MTKYADPFAPRCGVCCGPLLPDKDGRTSGFAHASWCRHAPRPPEPERAPLLPDDSTEDA